MTSLSQIDLIVVIAYAIGIFGLAQWVSREKAGHTKDTSDYFLASKSLPWWAIGASLIAANISAEQIVGMSGSGYAIGLAIASYEWMAALTLLIVGKWFLPIFLKNEIYTMPQFLEQRFGPTIRTVMAIFWLALYVFVNLTSILWLGSIAVTQVAGINQDVALFGLGVFALVYQLRGGLKAVALTDIVQVTLLVFGGLVISYLTLSQIGGDAGVLGGFNRLTTELPEKFDMILSEDNPFYKDLPGLSVLIGGMWIANLSYWGFNQYIIQRALAAKSLGEAQKGVVFAAFLKLLMPVIIVLPGIAAVLLAPDLAKPDQAYPTMMGLLPVGLLGLVFAALVAAIIASTASKINSVATIFTLDLYAKAKGVQNRAQDASGNADLTTAHEKQLVLVGRITAVVATLLAIVTARPLLGSLDQAFQYIQEFSGFVTPGITVIFLLGLFWKGATEAGALVGAVASVLLSFLFWFPADWGGIAALNAVPFMNRMMIVFFISLALAVVVSLARPAREDSNRISMQGVSFGTTAGFNIAGAIVVVILIALYTAWW
ncbi:MULTISPECIES: sodium/sugar symporter [unclassified Sphingomonas]|uniref:sodium/sugar symporter n=1 Tax=unclassified Sphingomonas TaxID=196159 RepID=UPI0021519B0E|nr:MULTISPECIES: sodium/sugar symporter [unclassified Sphingomonas]MCR5869385.1 sodium/sugar symporter [Sphingomonas sp. J344]UUX98882.1 sodium/sugar symporter [Sphingomonas sp. J315]